MVSIKTFTEQYNREHREHEIAALMRVYSLTREDAETMYDRDMKDVVEAAIVGGEVDPDMK